MKEFCKKCNQDVDVSIVEKSNQHTAYCTICGCYIKNIPYSTKNRAKYHDYLKSDTWKDKRDGIILRDFFCADCKTYLSTEVHHITYERIFNELDSDLVGLCASCHGKRHGIERYNRLSEYDEMVIAEIHRLLEKDD